MFFHIHFQMFSPPVGANMKGPGPGPGNMDMYNAYNKGKLCSSCRKKEFTGFGMKNKTLYCMPLLLRYDGKLGKNDV